MRAQGDDSETANDSLPPSPPTPRPHIDLFVLVEWQVLHEDRVGFDCLRV